MHPRNVVDAEVKNGTWVVELLVLRHIQQKSNAVAVKKRQLGRRPEKKTQAERISIEGNRSIEIVCVHRDLSDSGKTENGGQGTLPCSGPERWVARFMSGRIRRKRTGGSR